jgi:hypothetical protein
MAGTTRVTRYGKPSKRGRPGWEQRNTPPEGGVGTPWIARLEPYRPRYRAGIGTLAVFHQVAGRFTGPEPSAPLWILLPAHYMKGARIGQAVASDLPQAGLELIDQLARRSNGIPGGAHVPCHGSHQVLQAPPIVE